MSKLGICVVCRTEIKARKHLADTEEPMHKYCAGQRKNVHKMAHNEKMSMDLTLKIEELRENIMITHPIKRWDKSMGKEKLKEMFPDLFNREAV